MSLGVAPRGKEMSQSSLAATEAGARLPPEVANALGIHDDEEQEEKREQGRDPPGQVVGSMNYNSNDTASLGRHISTHSDAFRSAAHAGRFGEDSVGQDTAPPSSSRLPEQRRRPQQQQQQHTTSRAYDPIVVEAVPVQHERDSYPQPVQLVSEPPLAHAVPVPESDQPDQNTSGISYHKSLPLGQVQLAQLKSFGYSAGLIDGLDALKQRFPIRFWLVDNSGSMLMNDGCELRGEFTNPHVVDCTRWAELKETVSYHASLAGLLGTNTVFRLLNEPDEYACPQVFSVADPSSKEPPGECVKRAKKIVSNIVPKGFTPLASHLQSIRDAIKAIEATLRSRGQQAVVVIATDGLPTDEAGESTPEAREAVRKGFKSLQNLPAWTVIRLCTDDPEVVGFYNSLDKELELSVEVIDDYFHEAQQVTSHNPWLNYAMPLHRCREMGFHTRVLDLLDERLLTKDELMDFLKVIFSEASMLNCPDPHTDWKKFTAFLQALLDLERENYNPLSKKKTQWVDMRRLNKCYAPPGTIRSFFRFGK